MQQPGPQERILLFLLKLPTTIRADVLALVLLYATGEPSQAEAESIDRLAKLLGEPPGPRLVSATLRTLAAIDYVMTKSPPDGQDAAFLSRLAAFAPPAVAALAEHLLLGLPLRQRHHRHAQSEWIGLRAGDMTMENLRAFEARCLAPCFDRALTRPAPAELDGALQP